MEIRLQRRECHISLRHNMKALLLILIFCCYRTRDLRFREYFCFIGDCAGGDKITKERAS